MTAEAVVVTPLLVVLLIFLAVVVHRGVDARLRLDDAAHQAARAASLQRSIPAATAAAGETSSEALADAGLVCSNVTTSTAGTFTPGGALTVTVGCTVDFGQALLLGVPGTTTLQSAASEVLDTYRSQPVAASTP